MLTDDITAALTFIWHGDYANAFVIIALLLLVLMRTCSINTNIEKKNKELIGKLSYNDSLQNVKLDNIDKDVPFIIYSAIRINQNNPNCDLVKVNEEFNKLKK